jgi:hypothetical protein
MVGAFLLTVGLGTAAAEPREVQRAEQAGWSEWSALSAFGDTLIAIWSDVGGSLDPFGGEKPTGQSGSGGIAPTPERE